MPISFEDFSDDEVYHIGKFVITGKEMKDLCQKTVISVIGDPGNRPRKWFVRAGSGDYDEIQRTLYNQQEYDYSLRVAVSGPVYVTVGSDGASKPKPKKPVIMVSTPGLSFHAKRLDNEKFVVNGTIPSEKQEDVIKKMKRTWFHILSCFQYHKVTTPVLCAIGCGSFAGGIRVV